MDGLIHLDWTRVNGVPKLRFYMTNTAGRPLAPILTDLPVAPYFFAYADKVALLEKMQQGVKITKTNLNYANRPLVKIEVESPDQVPDIRAVLGIESVFEADVPYGRRVMIDFDLAVEMPKRYLYYDIEVDPSQGMPSETEAAMPILSIGAMDNEGNEFFFCEDDEKATISKFLLFADQYPAWCSFYGNHFDYPYLVNRCNNLGIEFWFDNFVHVDLLALYKFVLQKRQDEYSLDFLAKVEELGIEKMQIDISKLRDYYEHDRATLREYNMGDVRIMRLLDEKLHMVEILANTAAISHTSIKDLLRLHEKSYREYNTSVAVDGLILYLSGRRSPRVVWPTKKYKEEGEDEKKEKKYAGGLVLPPVPGVHDNVAILDVGSLYPTIIQSFNIGLEAYRADNSGDIKSPIGRGSFVSQPKSIFAEALEKVTSIRREYKKRMKEINPATQEWKDAYAMDYAWKVLGVSMYGVIGAEFSRYYNKDIAENVTLTGQAVLGFLKQSLENKGMTVIFGDTDSVAFTMKNMTLGAANAIAEELTTEVVGYLEKPSGIRPTLLKLEVDKLCSAIFVPTAENREANIGTKKHYAALVTWQGVPTLYLLVKGFEAARHDSSQAQKEFQTQGLLLRLNRASVEQRKMFIEHWQRQLYGGKLDDKIIMRKGLGKNPEDYKVLPPHLRIGRRLEAEGKRHLHKGDKIAFLKIGPKPEQVIAANSGLLSLTKENYDYIWKSQFVKIAKRLGISA